jgi:hypothetical protein
MPRTNHIFVDLENLPVTDLDRIADKPVLVTLVLGRRHKTMPVKLVKMIHKFSSQISLVETELEGRNALDFVLACLVGDHSARDPGGYFHVLSRDTGFDALIAHLKSRGLLAARHASMSAIPVLMDAAERARALTQLFTDDKITRPRKRSALEAQVHAMFGKTLNSAEIADTIDQLVRANTLTFSDTELIHYAP